jgi:hypothetical protein
MTDSLRGDERLGTMTVPYATLLNIYRPSADLLLTYDPERRSY